MVIGVRKLLILSVLLTCCGVGTTPSPVLVPTASNAENACKILEFYGCAVAKPNERGESCAAVFGRVEGPGYMPARSACIVRNSDSLDAIRKCGVKC